MQEEKNEGMSEWTKERIKKDIKKEKKTEWEISEKKKQN